MVCFKGAEAPLLMTDEEFAAQFAAIGSKIDGLRVELMGRMDGLQDAATKQGHDFDTLLDLMASNQRIAETATATARASTEIGTANSSALTKLLQRQRALEAELQAIKDRLNGSE